MPTVLALDLSSTRTGICLDGTVGTITPGKGTVLDRARGTRAHVADICARNQPDLIVIEAIGTRMVNTVIALATVHALVLDRIDGHRIQMVSPAELKKYATGKGNADKDTVMLAAAKLCPTITNNDEADAWWLWAIGMHLLEAPAFVPTVVRMAVVGKLAAAA